MFFQILWAIFISLQLMMGVDLGYTPDQSHLLRQEACQIDGCYPPNTGTGDVVAVALDDDLLLECDLAGDWCGLFDLTSQSEYHDGWARQICDISLDQSGERWRLWTTCSNVYVPIGWTMTLPQPLQNVMEQQRN